MCNIGDEVKVTWGMFEGMEAEVTLVDGKNVTVMLAAGFEYQLSVDHIESLNPYKGKTFEQVLDEITQGDWKPNTKAFEKIRNRFVYEVDSGENEYVLKGDFIKRTVDGIVFENRMWCRVRKTGASLKKKLGTEWTVTM
jgi:hypothetical protein